MFGYLFLISGLFLGWSLGANDASNIFGTAVGTRMVKFRTAAIIGSIFVILGAVIQGFGTTETLSRLGSVDAVGGAFTVALCAAIIVTLMTKYRLPVSTGQAIVGAIIGWCFYTATPVDYSVLVKILGSWVFGPILGMLFGYVLYIFLRKYIRSSRIHMLKMEAIIRASLIVVGAFAAYSLGANNIANVMGVFVNSFNVSLTIGSLYISSTQLLFFIGSLAIALGICTYSKKVIDTVGSGVLAMTPEMAIVVVLAQALVLFIFSSTALSNALVSIGLPAIPLVPVSSTQVLIGAIIGVGLVKGIQELKLKMVGGIMLGWVTTPVLSALFTFISLFFVERVFGMQVSKGDVALEPLGKAEPSLVPIEYHVPTSNVNTFFLVMLIVLLVGVLLYLFLSREKALAKAQAEGRREAREKLFSDYQNATRLKKQKTAVDMGSEKLEIGQVSKPRFEFRSFGRCFRDAAERMARLSVPVPEAVRERHSSEIYIVSRTNDVNNIKIRDGKIDIKTYVQTIDGLEQWNPLMKGEFPISASTLSEEVFPAFKVNDLPELTQEHYTLEEFLEMVERHPDLQAVIVEKVRYGYMVNDTICETGEVYINGAMLQTINSESTEVEDVLRTIREVGLEGVENINYLQAIKRVIGMINKPLAN